jgi:hypothetical protein
MYFVWAKRPNQIWEDNRKLVTLLETVVDGGDFISRPTWRGREQITVTINTRTVFEQSRLSFITIRKLNKSVPSRRPWCKPVILLSKSDQDAKRC